MSTSEPEKPKRRRRRSKADAPETPDVTPTSDAPHASAASDADVTPEVTPTEEDVAAEHAAEDVVLEAADEVDADSEAADAHEDAEEAEEAEAAKSTASRSARPARPAPARRRSRSQRDPSLPPPTVRAHAKYVRSSARKARLVCDHIRGKSVEDARAILALTPRAVARDWSKLLESAVANAEHNHELVGEDLVIKAVKADEGPTIKRFRPRAMGRATKIRKRTSHLTILLTPKD
jgi:ribosomal protein L22